MQKLLEKDFEVLNTCPWCNNLIKNEQLLFLDDFKCPIIRCSSCGVVFAKKRINESGREKYWADYSSRVHTSDSLMVQKRQLMYQIDYNFINKYLPKNAKILDVGCGEGDFLDLFKSNGYITSGVEYGSEAAIITSKKHTLFKGEFPKLQITEKFDLIIFRGVLQYLENPKEYLDKAISLLNNTGGIFITAQPNMDSFVFSLFGKGFPVPVTAIDFCHYTESVFDNFFCGDRGLEKIEHAYFYEETPYADIENDILKVAKAIELKRAGKTIDFKGPAFYGNMMTLFYRKR